MIKKFGFPELEFTKKKKGFAGTLARAIEGM